MGVGVGGGCGGVQQGDGQGDGVFLSEASLKTQHLPDSCHATGRVRRQTCVHSCVSGAGAGV